MPALQTKECVKAAAGLAGLYEGGARMAGLAEGNVPVVMLVDDYEDTRQMMRRMLEMHGCLVLEAANGQEAIALAQSDPPDLILMDLNMPVLDGFNATLRIREYEPTRDVPVVAVTAYDTAEFRAAASAVGCTDYVVKPLDLDRLAALLERLLPSLDHAGTAGQSK